jgi:predicted nucleotidyltransferase
MEFWNDIIIQKSWDLLKKLNKQLHFIVIGGWGIYLWTQAMKSKDIDVLLTRWEDLEEIKKQYEPKKNDRLKKYEIIISDIDVDIYLPHYSEMIIPCDQLISMSETKEGFQVLKPEPLLILKQQALCDRKDSIKGQKDRVDILSLLLSKTIDFNEYKRLIELYKIPYFADELKKMIRVAKEEFTYFKITNPRKIKKLKEEWIQPLIKK